MAFLGPLIASLAPTLLKAGTSLISGIAGGKPIGQALGQVGTELLGGVGKLIAPEPMKMVDRFALQEPMAVGEFEEPDRPGTITQQDLDQLVGVRFDQLEQILEKWPIEKQLALMDKDTTDIRRILKQLKESGKIPADASELLGVIGDMFEFITGSTSQRKMVPAHVSASNIHDIKNGFEKFLESQQILEPRSEPIMEEKSMQEIERLRQKIVALKENIPMSFESAI